VADEEATEREDDKCVLVIIALPLAIAFGVNAKSE
jgi:hypothetical protein